MVLLGHDSPEEVAESAKVLAALGEHARKLLSECVEATGVKRKQVSGAAKALESEGFLFILDTGDIFESQFELRPSLTGEEALLALDEMNEKRG